MCVGVELAKYDDPGHIEVKRTVQTRGSQTMPIWDKRNLEVHYKKHPAGACASCWSSLLGKPGPIALADYEGESLSVAETPTIKFSALYRQSPAQEEARCRYYIDSKLILTSVNGNTDKVRTSFRMHAPPARHSAECSVAEWLRQIERLAEKRFSQEGSMRDVRGVEFDLSGFDDKAASAIREKARRLTRMR